MFSWKARWFELATRIIAKLSEGKTTVNWKSWVAGGCLVMIRLIKKQLGGI